MPSSRDLHGARVLITGASSGVGAAAAVAFAQAGADVALLARSEPGLRAVAARLPGRSLVLPVDVADAAAVEAAVARVVQEWGGLDVAVSNAAAMAFGAFARVEPRDFDRTVQVTFLGAVNVIRAALPALERSGGGTVVVTGSINGRTPLPSFSAYAASKAALRSFVQSLRIELEARRSPVRLAVVNPGAIATPVWGNVTSATGRLPRTPPEGYAAEVVATALVDVARRPRREITVGGEARFWLRLWRTPLVGELVLAIVHRYYNSGRRPATTNPLWEPTADGATRSPTRMVSRPSILERLLR